MNKHFARKPDLVLELFVPRATQSQLKQDTSNENGFSLSPSKPAALTSGADETQVNMHVSSKHLTEASPYFEALLDGSFSEGVANNASASRRIPLKGIDPTAFALLMDILHLRTKSLAAQSIDFETFYQVCVLIDMYTLHEQALLHTEGWFNLLKPEMSDRSSESLDRWIFITYVLGKNSTFQTLTSVLQQSHVGAQYLSKTPLPSHIEKSLQVSRNKAFTDCMNQLRVLLASYGNVLGIKCRQSIDDCDALVLGALIRSLKRCSLYPPSDDLLDTISITSLLARLDALETPSLCSTRNESSRKQFGNPISNPSGYTFGTTSSAGIMFGTQSATKFESPFRSQFGTEKLECGVGNVIQSISRALRDSSQGISLPEGSTR